MRFAAYHPLGSRAGARVAQRAALPHRRADQPEFAKIGYPDAKAAIYGRAAVAFLKGNNLFEALTAPKLSMATLVTCRTAKSPTDAAVIAICTPSYHNFTEHGNRTYWFELDTAKLSKLIDVEAHEIEDMLGDIQGEDEQMAKFVRQTSTTHEILNAKLEALYFQRNDVTDESWYFTRVTTNKGDKQTTITGDQLSSPSKLETAFIIGICGCTLDRVSYAIRYHRQASNGRAKKSKPRTLLVTPKSTKPISLMMWQYLKAKSSPKTAKTITKSVALKSNHWLMTLYYINTKDKPDFSWWHNFHRVRGAYGTIVMAWWLGTYFTEQSADLIAVTRF